MTRGQREELQLNLAFQNAKLIKAFNGSLIDKLQILTNCMRLFLSGSSDALACCSTSAELYSQNDWQMTALQALAVPPVRLFSAK